MPAIIRFTCALDPIYGGVPRGVSMISKETSNRGLSTSIVSCGNSRSALRRSKSERALLNSLRIKVLTSRALFSNPYGIGGFIGLALRISKLEKPKLIVLHQIWSFSTLLGFLYSRLCHVKLAIMPHGSLSHYHQLRSKHIKKVATHLFIEKALMSANHIVVTSGLEKSELESKLAKKAIIIPYGSDITIPKSVNKIDGRIIFAGRITNKKNLNQVIYALPLIREEFPNIELIVAGDGHPSEVDDIKRLVKKLGLEAQVQFLGWLDRDELILNLTLSQVFVLPSEYENFGHAVMESLVCGTPVVVSNKVALCEIVSKYKAGVVIQKNTPSEISDAVRSTLRNPIENSNLAKIASKYEFSWDVIADSWRSLIDN